MDDRQLAFNFNPIGTIRKHKTTDRVRKKDYVRSNFGKKT